MEEYTPEMIEQLIEEDYYVRNENPCYLIHDYIISVCGVSNNMLYTDCEINPEDFHVSIEELEQMLIKHKFKNVIGM
jgi:hypothetical protein